MWTKSGMQEPVARLGEKGREGLVRLEYGKEKQLGALACHVSRDLKRTLVSPTLAFNSTNPQPITQPGVAASTSIRINH